MSVLKVENLGKAYRAYPSEWHRVLRWMGVNSDAIQQNWIVRNISFEIFEGEAFALIGKNGAGKSTLLKMITGTSKPSEGQVISNGKIAAILELGLGFNYELTGRQNAYHTLGLMGVSGELIKDLVTKVEDFAEIGDYFDKPIRIYSSGMIMRVAFSIVTAIRPDILIVDEALSVGDAYFQHKSFEKIKQFKKQGTSILLVSHDLGAIKSICERAIVLNNGQEYFQGLTEEAADHYNALIADDGKNVSNQNICKSDKKLISGNGKAKFLEYGLYDLNGNELSIVGVGEEVEIKAKVEVHENLESLVFGYCIRDRYGRDVYGTNTWHTGDVLNRVKSGEQIEYKIQFPANLGVGNYSIQIALVDKETHLTDNYEWIDLAIIFEVINKNKVKFVGCNWNEPKVYIAR